MHGVAARGRVHVRRPGRRWPLVYAVLQRHASDRGPRPTRNPRRVSARDRRNPHDAGSARLTRGAARQRPSEDALVQHAPTAAAARSGPTGRPRSPAARRAASERSAERLAELTPGGARSRSRRWRRRSPKGLLVGGGVVGLVAVGVGAWAAVRLPRHGTAAGRGAAGDDARLRQHRPRPERWPEDRGAAHAQQVPGVQGRASASTPTTTSARRSSSRIQDEAHCDDLDYADDIEPWLGDRAAVAAVDLGGDDPDPVVRGPGQGRRRGRRGPRRRSRTAATATASAGGWAIDGDWAVIAETDDIADKVVDATEKGSLADDDDFQQLDRRGRRRRAS